MGNKKCENCNTLNSEVSKYCSQCGYTLPKTVSDNNIVNEEKVRKPENKRKIVPIVVGILTFFIAFYFTQQLFNNSNSFDDVLMQTASEMNKNCPFMIDQETQLDNTHALPNNVFQYNYTLINLEKQNVDIDQIKSYLEPKILNNVKSDPNMKVFREKEVTINYNYKDKHGDFILLISATPEKYK
jgi:hypothetical protein